MRGSRWVRVSATTAVLAMATAGGAGGATRAQHGDQRSRLERHGFTAPKVARASSAGDAQATPATWDQDPAVEARADALVAQMTTAEKADLATGQINNFYGFYNNPI